MTDGKAIIVTTFPLIVQLSSPEYLISLIRNSCFSSSGFAPKTVRCQGVSVSILRYDWWSVNDFTSIADQNVGHTPL